jgi:hypothetical protein
MVADDDNSVAWNNSSNASVERLNKGRRDQGTVSPYEKLKLLYVNCARA